MLVLSRKQKEKLVINGDITITVVAIIGGRVKIAIEAPADVAILRGELVGRGEGRSLAAGLGVDTARSLERDVNGGQAGADNGSADLLPTPIIAAEIKDPLSRLRKIPR